MDRVLVVFVDALGPAQRDLSRSLSLLTPNATSLRGVAGYSSGALATVLTGANAAAHGRLCLFSARAPDAPRSPLDALSWLRLLPRVVHERGAVRRRVARWLAEREGITGYLALHKVPPEMFRWLDIPERDDLFQAEAIGGARTFLGDARACGLDVFAARWSLPEDERWRDALATLAARRPRLTFLYSAELDAVLHRDGEHAHNAATTLDRLAERVATAQRHLSQDGARVATVLVGDHGMRTVTRTIDPRSVTNGTRCFVDSTLLRLWGTTTDLARVRRAVERARWPGRWIDGEGLRAWGVGTHGSPWGDAWVQLDEGVVFAPSHIGGPPRGMHGYGPDAPSSRASLSANVPLPSGCLGLTDVAPFVRSLVEGLS
jgi:hypothetical protein